MPSITRRHLLGGIAAAAGTYGTYRLHRGAASATFESWTPESGTWPLRRYDPEGTAHNPNASPPRRPPTANEIASVLDPGRRPRLDPVVGPDHVVVSGTGAAAYPRTGSEGSVPVGPAALAGFGPDGRLHTVRPAPEPAVVDHGADGLRERSRVPLGVEGGGSDPTAIVVGASEVYVGVANGTLQAVDRAGRDWDVDGSLPTLAEGRLYAADAPLAGTVAYSGRRGLDRRLEPGPERVWSAGPVDGFPHRPAVADGRLVIGSYAEDGGAVVALDADTGDRLWDPRDLGADVSTPAVVGDRGYVTVDHGDGSGHVVALDLSTGETRWGDAVEFGAFGPVVGGDTLVVAGERRGDGGGVVRAYDTETGDVLWTHGVDHGPGGLALVDERVFVTAGPSLYRLA
ncbi:PQQ-binding-like beta-propeller repeat protein [Haloplanus salilacus]|uniref:outer membrane protein assembly factor BamB family protein n=1 Tax=Haloplanus salilacus TaxID=2949994 RepID=UPI0030CF74A6